MVSVFYLRTHIIVWYVVHRNGTGMMHCVVYKFNIISCKYFK